MIDKRQKITHKKLSKYVQEVSQHTKYNKNKKKEKNIPPSPRAYLRGGGVQGVQTPPKFSDFFLKSEGKEIERKRKKRDVCGGGYLLTYFWG